MAIQRHDEVSRRSSLVLVVEAVADGDPTLIRALPDELTARLALSIARSEVGIARADDRLPRVDGAPHHTPSHLANLSRSAGRHVRGLSSASGEFPDENVGTSRPGDNQRPVA
jgi:hypothetical protein